jgi:hypothetical protein
VVKLRAAIENKIRPSAMLFHEQPDLPWTKFDFLLLEAYQTLQDETCSMCGNPIWVCRNEFADNVGFKIKSAKCFAKAELDRHQEREEKKKKKNKKHGEQEYVLAYAYDGGELPTRMSYFNSLAQQATQSDDTNSV